eukprot:tig00020537_g10273.t1
MESLRRRHPNASPAAAEKRDSPAAQAPASDFVHISASEDKPSAVGRRSASPMTPRKRSPSPSRDISLLRALRTAPPPQSVFHNSTFGLLLIVLTAAAVTREPPLTLLSQSVVFDEVHFGGFANRYCEGRNFFDIHRAPRPPPLGKLILAAAARMRPEYKCDFNFGAIGNRYSENSTGVPYALLRSFPAAASVASAGVVFALGRRLGMSPATSTLAGLLFVLEPAILLQSRLVLIDSFLLLFALVCLLASFSLAEHLPGAGKGREPFTRRYWACLLATGAAAGLAVSVKWTALASLAAVGLHHAALAVLTIRASAPGRPARLAWADALTLPARPRRWLHFAALPRSGPGDAFYTPAFRAALEGGLREGETLEGTPLPFLARVREMNRVMFKSNSGLRATHPYQSVWHEWPLGRGSMFYWSGAAQPETWPNGQPKERRIFLLLNPAVAYPAAAALLAFCVFAAYKVLFEVPFAPGTLRLLWTGALLLASFALNLLPYALVQRSTFLYHYFPALLPALLLACALLEHALRARPALRAAACAAAAAVAAAFFVYLAPFVYALPLTPEGLAARMRFYHMTGPPPA